MNELFTNYTITIIRETFGFTPAVDILELPGKVIQVTLDGLPQERKEMMGKEAHTFQALKLLMKIFAHKHDRLAFLYIRSTLNEGNNKKA